MKTMKDFRRAMLWMTLCATCLIQANAANTTNDSNEEDDPYKDVISPQWGMKCPEGYTRLTEYREQSYTDKQAKKQYKKLTKTIDKANDKRKKTFQKAYAKGKKPRYVEVEKTVKAKTDRLFERADIKLLPKGAYQLKDGTIVIQDDKNTLNAEARCYHPKAMSAAPTIERDKSPNYSAYNEQTWPVYANLETVDSRMYNRKPEVIRGKDCTYLITYTLVNWDFMWFHPSSGSSLVDPKTGNRYMVRYLEHMPLDTYYWIHGHEGEIVRRVFVYPPLPEDVTVVDYIPGRMPTAIQLSNLAPYQEFPKLPVQRVFY